MLYFGHMSQETNQGYNILVFEDDPAYRASYVSALESRGFNVKTVDSPLNCSLQEIKDFGPDIISYDVMMPGVTGFEAAKNQVLDPDLKTVPFVFVTSTAGEKEKEKGVAIGCAGYYPKYEVPIPTIVSELERIIAHSTRQ